MYPDEILEADNREPLTRGDAASDNTKRSFQSPRHRLRRHDHFITKPAICRHAVSGHGDIISSLRQSEGRGERVFHVAHILVIMAAGAPKNLISYDFSRRRSVPCELDGSRRCMKRLG